MDTGKVFLGKGRARWEGLSKRGHGESGDQTGQCGSPRERQEPAGLTEARRQVLLDQGAGSP